MYTVKEIKRIARHKRIRKKLESRPDVPRLCVHRSLQNLYVQIIDDEKAYTIFSFSTLDKEIRANNKYGGNISAAESLGMTAAQKLKQKGIKCALWKKMIQTS